MKTRGAVLCAAAAATALLAYYLVSWAQVSPLRERGTDFSASYVAALVIRDGQGARLYDQAYEHDRHLALLPPGTVIDLPFITPPTTAVLALPFTTLDLGTAYRAWSLLQLALLAIAIAIVVRAAPWPEAFPRAARWATGGLGLAGVGAYSFLLLGQIDGIPALGLAAWYVLWRRDRLAWAGGLLALSFAATKPQLGIGLAVFILARRDRRMLTGAAAGVAVAVLVALLAAGPSAFAGFVSSLVFALGNTPAASTVGAPGLVASWFDGGAVAGALGLALAIAALAGCAALGDRSRHCGRRIESVVTGAIALSLLASPHVLTHDLVLLDLPFVWLMARAAGADGEQAWPGPLSRLLLAGWVVVNLTVDLDTGNGAAFPPGRLVPWSLIVVALAAAAGTWGLLGRAYSGSGSGPGGSSE